MSSQPFKNRDTAKNQRVKCKFVNVKNNTSTPLQQKIKFTPLPWDDVTLTKWTKEEEPIFQYYGM